MFKKGDPSDVMEYHLYRSWRSLFKILEPLISPFVALHVNSNIFHNKHGFIGSLFINNVIQVLDIGAEVDVVYTDFSNVYDRLSHFLLVKSKDTDTVMKPLC